MIKDFDRDARHTIEKVLAISKLQALCLVIIIFNLYLSNFNFFAFVLRGFVGVVFFVLFLRAIKRLLYSYWAFLLVLTLYAMSFFISMILGKLSLGETLIILILVALNVLQATMMIRPVYYPRPNWWEYDFRLRSDLKAKMNSEGQWYNIRISDARMGEISIYSFHELESGEKVVISHIEGMDDFSLSFDVVTVRNNIVGRPDIVGLKPSDGQNMAHYAVLQNTLRSKKLLKKRFIRYE